MKGAESDDVRAPELTRPDVAEEDHLNLAHASLARPNLVVPLLFAALGLLYLWSVRGLNWQSKGYGVAAASLLVLFSVVGFGLELRRLASARDAAPSERHGAPVRRAARPDWSASMVLLAIGLLVAAVLVAKRVGLYPVFAVYLPVQMWLLRERNPVVLLAVDAGTLVVFYIVFVHVLKMYLPLW